MNYSSPLKKIKEKPNDIRGRLAAERALTPEQRAGRAVSKAGERAEDSYKRERQEMLGKKGAIDAAITERSAQFQREADIFNPQKQGESMIGQSYGRMIAPAQEGQQSGWAAPGIQSVMQGFRDAKRNEIIDQDNYIRQRGRDDERGRIESKIKELESGLYSGDVNNSIKISDQIRKLKEQLSSIR
jgi:hypothetical protein